MTSSNAALPKRQHPISIFFFIVKSVKDMLYPLIAAIVSTVMRRDVHPLWLAAGAAVFLAVTVTLGILSWRRYTYTIERGSMHVEYGLFVRKKLSVPRERVQSIDMSAGLVQRLFGVLKLQIETAGGRKPEVLLSAVAREEADRIRTAMYASADAPGTAAPDEAGVSALGSTDAAEHGASAGAEYAGPSAAYPAKRLPLGIVLLYSATSGRVFLSLALLGALYSQVDDLIRDADLWDAGAALAPHDPNGWIAFGAAAFFALWLIGVLLTTAKEYGFTVSRSDGKLTIRRGLFERKQLSVSLHRIQAVHVKQNAVRRMLGYASVSLVTAVLTEKDGMTQAMLCPLVPAKELPQLLAEFVPGYRWPARLERLDRRSLGSYLALPAVLASIAAVPGLVWIPYGFGWTALLVPAAVVWWSWLRYRTTGWTEDGGMNAFRYGGFGVHTALVPRRRIQWIRTSVSPLQARRRLATLRVSLASGALAVSYGLRHIPADQAAELLETMRGRRI